MITLYAVKPNSVKHRKANLKLVCVNMAANMMNVLYSLIARALIELGNRWTWSVTWCEQMGQVEEP